MADQPVTRDSSILRTVSKLIGGDAEATYFDLDLIVAINTSLAILTQLGVGPEEGFSIVDDTATWYDFIGDDKRLSMVVSYVALKTGLIFDPPNSGVLREMKESLVQEMEYRSFLAADPASYGADDP